MVDDEDDDDDDRSDAGRAQPDEPPEVVAQRERALAQRAEYERGLKDQLFVREHADGARKYANELFKQGKLEEAAIAYERCLPLVDDDAAIRGDPNAPPPSAVLHANLAAVRLKQLRWKEALAECDAALALHSGYAKALFRKAQAQRGKRAYKAALATIAHARKMSLAAAAAGAGAPSSASVELDELESKVRVDMKKRKAERQAAIRAKGLPLPPATQEDAGFSRDWSTWFRDELIRDLSEIDLLWSDADEMCRTKEVPPDDIDCNAYIKTQKDGSRALFLDLTNVTVYAQAASFRGSVREPGMMSVEVAVRVGNVDHANIESPEEWSSQANPRSTPHEAGMVKSLMERRVRTEFVDACKAAVAKALSRVRSKAHASTMTPSMMDRVEAGIGKMFRRKDDSSDSD